MPKKLQNTLTEYSFSKKDIIGVADEPEEDYDLLTVIIIRLGKETEEKGGGNALVISSGSEIPTILELIVPGQYKGEDISNCSATIVEYKDGKYTLKTIGDTSYTEKGSK